MEPGSGVRISDFAVTGFPIFKVFIGEI